MISVMSKPKKKPQAEPDKANRGPVLYLRLTEEHEAALQSLIKSQRIKPDRTAVGLTALEELLHKEGFWPPNRS
jgi:hypothetical protein